MDDTSITLGNILEQAPSWTFAGDVTLLQWMKQISQDLESRATKTTDGLVKLDNNVKSTNVALHNVANTLTVLQFGNQFVESRVQDDDEALFNVSDATLDEQEEFGENMSSKEMISTFLDNNLKVLRNCHEKYSIVLKDSDDEENGEEKTCIYQPINPYNDRPLPYIFGSKDWHSKWHVGLYENQEDNSYSCDEISETYSESSATTSPLDDNESFESNTEWPSSNSIDNDHLNSNIEIKNASSLLGSQPIHPVTTVPINATNKITKSETSSLSATSSLGKKPLANTQQASSFPQRPESVSSTSSKNSSKATARTSSHKKESISQYKKPIQNFVNLFAEPPDNLAAITPSAVSSVQSITRIPSDNVTISKKTPSLVAHQPTPFVDLFPEPPEDIVSSAMPSNQNAMRRPVNLFEDEDDGVATDDLLSVLSKKKGLEIYGNKESNTLPLPAAKSNTTNQSSSLVKTSKLFDDSDEDDDFLKAFVTKSLPKGKTSTSLFDKESSEPILTSSLPQTNAEETTPDTKLTFGEKYNFDKTSNMFDDIKNNEDDSRLRTTTNDESKISMHDPDSKLLVKPIDEKYVTHSIKLFKDTDGATKNDDTNPSKIAQKINLFDEMDDDDLFSIKSKREETFLPQTIFKENNRSNESKENSFAAIKRDNDSEKITGNQLVNIGNLEKNKIPTQEINQPDDISFNKRKIENLIVTPNTTEKKISSSSLMLQNELLAGKESFDNYAQSQKDQNESSTIKQPDDKFVSVPEIDVPKSTASNKYEFNSILFLDEPPEDDKLFFQTLSKPTNKYNSIDLESDTYEPELPKVPATSTTKNQTDTSELFYAGMQLFSDVPPDDDDDVDGATNTLNIRPDDNQTRRLHSIFYDDFNETLMALNQNSPEKETLNQSLYNDEPPPIIEESHSISRDITDCKVPVSDTSTKFGETPYKADDENIIELSNKRPVSKLQMPNININVQALLPGANSSLRKTKEESANVNSTNTDSGDVNSAVGNSEETTIKNRTVVSKITTSDAPTTSKAEHILPNLTRTRVKVSAARRPSTRRGRQENYRKGLIEQQQQEEMLESGDDNSEIQARTSIPQTFLTTVKSVMTTQVQKQHLKVPISATSNLPTSERDYALIIKKDISSITEESSKCSENSSLVQNIKEPTSLEFLDEIPNNLKQTMNEPHEKVQVRIASEPKKISLLFEDEEDADDDFFKHTKTTKVTDTKIASNIKRNEDEKSAFSDAELNKLPQECKNYPPSKDVENILNKSRVQVEPAYHAIVNKSQSFLDDQHDGDAFLKATLQQSKCAPIQFKNKDALNKAKSQFKSFLDSESDEDLNVGGPQPTTQIHSTTASLTKTNVPQRKDQLFMAPESDSDDLFSKPASTAKPTAKAPPKKSSLFGDDSDSEDFQASSKSVSKNSVSKSSSKKFVPKTVVQTNTSLFTDLDSDEDDLFGGGTARVLSANVKTTAPSSIKPTANAAESSTLKTVDDNPLADLL